MIRFIKNTLLIFFLVSVNICYAQNIKIIDSSTFYGNRVSDSFYFLRDELKDVQIVALGESTHYAGTTFNAKVKMIQYLHDSLGFNVIAFESGMFDCSKANEFLQKGDTTLSHFKSTLFGIWDCQEVDELLHFMIKSQKTSNPITYSGFDNQFCFAYSANGYLLRGLTNLVDTLSLDKNTIITEAFKGALVNEIKYSNSYKKVSKEDTLALFNSLSTIVHKLRDKHLDTAIFYDYWLHIVNNIMTDYRKNHYKNEHLRDSIMAENILFLQKIYKGQKIILWGASTHFCNNRAEIVDNEIQKDGISTGQILKKQLHSGYYSIAFTAYQGRLLRDKGLFSIKIKKSSINGLEYWINKDYNCDFAFYPLRDNTNRQWLLDNAITKAKLFGISELKMNLPQICDAIFYIKNMHAPIY